MRVWILLAVLAALAAGSAVQMARADRKRRVLASNEQPKSLPSGATPRTDVPERGPGELRIGDILQYEARDYLCEGIVLFDEDGHRWRMARVEDSPDSLWVIGGFDRARGTTLVLREDPSIQPGAYPSDSLLVGSDVYALARRGVASCQLTGDLAGLANTQGRPSGHAERCRFWFYTRGDNAVMVEQWGSSVRCLRGSHLRDGDADLLPGS